MKTDDRRYFMAEVDLHSARSRIDRIFDQIKEGFPPSIDLIVACVGDLTSAMAKVSRAQLSDPRFKAPPPGCERGCGYAAEHHVCDLEGCRR